MAEAHDDRATCRSARCSGLLLEEFPDVTISKIRFLESQGLISPERTSSGYRKFYDDDVELLRVILDRAAPELSCRCASSRIDSRPARSTRPANTTDPNGDTSTRRRHRTMPTQRSTRSRPDAASRSHPRAPACAATLADTARRGYVRQHRRHHRAATETADDTTGETMTDAPTTTPTTEPASAAQLLPGVLLDRAELCSMVGMTDAELDTTRELRHRACPGTATGVPRVRRRRRRDRHDRRASSCGPASTPVTSATGGPSAEREASLYEQIVTPQVPTAQSGVARRSTGTAQATRHARCGAASRR